MRSNINEAIQTHYGRSGLSEVILAALEQAGADLQQLSLAQLAPIDEFHIRGRAATLELAQAVGLDSTNRVLDIGSGIGGTSRCLAIYDVLAGPSGPVLFPVPWARTPDTSFLVSPEELRQLLEDAGFTVTEWKDTTEEAREWFVKLAEKIRREGFPALGFHLLMGHDFREMAQNQGKNLEEGRISLGQVVSVK